MSTTTVTSASVNGHTTASVPHPHIVYSVQATVGDETISVSRRYSEFVILHQILKDSFSLPPKRILVTSVLPSAWVDDRLISERKAGLTAYLKDLISSTEYRNNAELLRFLTLSSPSAHLDNKFDIEDALPSTLSKNTALTLLAAAEVDDAVAAVDLVAASYYTDWSADSYPPERVDFSKFDILYFAFATPNSSSTLNWDAGSQGILQRLTTAARKSGKGTKIVLSVGGWSGSSWFSHAMSSASNRATFVNALSIAVNLYKLDGIDIDWEYPNSNGAGNSHSPSDTANFLAFLKALRAKLGNSKIISAAVTQQPWLGPNGRPLTDVSAFAAQMTYANIMNYDVWSSSPNPGPNAPLGDLCGNSEQPEASAEAALAQWTRAKFPANKLVLGLPLYGYVSKSTATHLRGNFTSSSIAIQDTDSVSQTTNETGETDAVKTDTWHCSHAAHARYKGTDSVIHSEDSGSAGNLNGLWGQQIPFKSLLSSGVLKKQSDGTYTGANGYTSAWDRCSDTPFLFDKARSTVVTYDDTRSLGDKATFAKQHGMAGCFTWALDQDDGEALQNVIRSSLGKK